MTLERHLSEWILAYVSYIGNMLVGTAVFFTVLIQNDLNDLLCNYAGLLVIINIDD